MITTPSGLQYEDTVAGAGDTARSGQHVSVHYSGWLHDPTAANGRGKKFDSSKDRGQPFSFGLGGGQVIGGWDEGVQGMKIGGTRVLLIPPRAGLRRARRRRRDPAERHAGLRGRPAVDLSLQRAARGLVLRAPGLAQGAAAPGRRSTLPKPGRDAPGPARRALSRDSAKRSGWAGFGSGGAAPGRRWWPAECAAW